MVGILWGVAGAALADYAVSPRAQAVAVRLAAALGFVVLAAVLAVGGLAGWEWMGDRYAAVSLALGFGAWAAVCVVWWLFKGGTKFNEAAGRRGWLALGGVSALVVVGLLIGGAVNQELAAASQSVEVAAPVAAVPVEAQAQAAAEPAAPGCDCSANAICTGPRGGKYCLTAEGKKRYING